LEATNSLIDVIETQRNIIPKIAYHLFLKASNRQTYAEELHCLFLGCDSLPTTVNSLESGHTTSLRAGAWNALLLSFSFGVKIEV